MALPTLSYSFLRLIPLTSSRATESAGKSTGAKRAGSHCRAKARLQHRNLPRYRGHRGRHNRDLQAWLRGIAAGHSTDGATELERSTPFRWLSPQRPNRVRARIRNRAAFGFRLRCPNRLADARGRRRQRVHAARGSREVDRSSEIGRHNSAPRRTEVGDGRESVAWRKSEPVRVSKSNPNECGYLEVSNRLECALPVGTAVPRDVRIGRA